MEREQTKQEVFHAEVPTGDLPAHLNVVLPDGRIIRPIQKAVASEIDTDRVINAVERMTQRSAVEIDMRKDGDSFSLHIVTDRPVK